MSSSESNPVITRWAHETHRDRQRETAADQRRTERDEQILSAFARAGYVEQADGSFAPGESPKPSVITAARGYLRQSGWTEHADGSWSA
jgi:hypothetical protein